MTASKTSIEVPQRDARERRKHLDSSRIGRGFDLLLESVVGALLVAMVVAALLQVVMRYVVDQPLAWPEEFVRWCFLWLVFLGGALAARVGAHVRIDMCLNLLPDRIRPAAEVLIVALTGLALGLLVFVGIEYAERTTRVSVNFHISQLYLYLAVPVGSALTLVNLARQRVDGVSAVVVAAAVAVGALAAWPLAATTLQVLEQFGPTSVVLVASLGLMLLGMPIAYALVLAAFLAFWGSALPSVVVIGRLTSTISADFILVAIPFFVFMGALMNIGGVTTALVRAAAALVGHWRGGLAQANVVTNAMLGGMSGSSAGDAAAVSKTLVPEMQRHGYDRAYVAAITSASSILANLLPPSISFLIFASLASASVGALFMAGVIPGLLVIVALMGTIFALSRGKRYAAQASPRASLPTIGRALAVSLPALALPVLILGLLRGGVVTPTEAGAVATLYALLLGIFIYRTVRVRKLLSAIVEAGRETSMVLLLIAGSAPLAWLLTVEGVPQAIAEGLGGVADNPLLFLLLLNLFLLIVGMPLEPAPAMVILVPILVPIAAAAGIDPIHLGVIMVLNLMVGSLTPPVGVLAFITAVVAKVDVMKVFAALVPFLLALIAVLLLVTFIPDLSLWLPERLGLGRTMTTQGAQ